MALLTAVSDLTVENLPRFFVRIMFFGLQLLVTAASLIRESGGNDGFNGDKLGYRN
jgi:hypothetical protein